MPRNTATRDRHRSVIARDKPDCALCGEPIDYTLKYPHPKSFVVDHVIPVALGGPDTLDNKQAACADCNWKKAAKVADEMQPTARAFVTPRTW